MEPQIVQQPVVAVIPLDVPIKASDIKYYPLGEAPQPVAPPTLQSVPLDQQPGANVEHALQPEPCNSECACTGECLCNKFEIKLPDEPPTVQEPTGLLLKALEMADKPAPSLANEPTVEDVAAEINRLESEQHAVENDLMNLNQTGSIYPQALLAAERAAIEIFTLAADAFKQGQKSNNNEDVEKLKADVKLYSDSLDRANTANQLLIVRLNKMCDWRDDFAARICELSGISIESFTAHVNPDDVEFDNILVAAIKRAKQLGVQEYLEEQQNTDDDKAEAAAAALDAEV